MKPLYFTDFDEYASVIRDVDIAVRLIHPRTQQHQWSLQQIEWQSLRLQFAVEGSGILAFGKMHQDGLGLYAQLSGAPVCVNGKKVGPGAIAVLPPNGEFQIAGQGTISWFSIFVPGPLFVGNVEPPIRSSSAYVQQGQKQVFKRLYSQARIIQRCTAETGLSYFRSLDCAFLQDELLSSVHEVLSCRENAQSEGSTRAKRLAAKAVELIHDGQTLNLSVRKLAAILDVSERTLQYAFRDQFDLSPQSFLINHRLHQARMYLQSSTTEQTTVATVAVNYGFFDFGRFATKYNQLFGEHPSVTLRRRT